MRRNGLPLFHTNHAESSTVPESRCYRTSSKVRIDQSRRGTLSDLSERGAWAEELALAVSARSRTVHSDSMRRNGLPLFHTSRTENSTVPESRCYHKSSKVRIDQSRRGSYLWA